MPQLPIACTLGPQAVEARREDLLGTLIRRGEERLDIPNGYRIRFNASGGILASIARVVDLERRCCRFLTFHVIIESDERPIWLEFSGPPGTREFLASMLDL